MMWAFNIKKDKYYTSVHYKKKEMVKRGEGAEIDLMEKIPVLILILEIFPNSCLEMKKSF
jgi:hypothetical protein